MTIGEGMEDRGEGDGMEERGDGDGMVERGDGEVKGRWPGSLLASVSSEASLPARLEGRLLVLARLELRDTGEKKMKILSIIIY